MPPEITGPLIAAIVALLGIIPVVALFLPPFIKRQIELRQKAQEERIEEERKKLDNALKAAEQEREEQKKKDQKLYDLVDATIDREKSGSAQLESLVKALTTQVENQSKQIEIAEAHRVELRANTNITREGVETIGELSGNVETLIGKFDELNTRVLAFITTQSSSETRLNALITEIVALKNSAERTLQTAQSRLDDVRKTTGENPAVNVNINPSPNPSPSPSTNPA